MPKTMSSHINFHTIAAAAIASAGIVLASTSPSLACYVTATPCWGAPMPDVVGPAPALHGGRLYNMVPGGSATFSPRPSHRVPQRDHAPANSK
ncbi:MAG: hypothetical protein WA851_06165 [Xanthobacteraceae bacterium]